MLKETGDRLLSNRYCVGTWREGEDCRRSVIVAGTDLSAAGGAPGRSIREERVAAGRRLALSRVPRSSNVRAQSIGAGVAARSVKRTVAPLPCSTLSVARLGTGKILARSVGAGSRTQGLAPASAA